jgi:hypothetical protein
MRKTILTILGSALLAVSTVQIATAAERHKVHRAPAPVADQYRNSNAKFAGPAPVQPGWSRYDEWSRYQNGGMSAPAGQ